MHFTFPAELYHWHGDSASWVFIDLPEDIAEEIKDAATGPRRGFGSIRVEVGVGAYEWRTSIFPSKESGSFMLPVKQEARRRGGIDVGDIAEFRLRLLEDGGEA